MWLVLLLLLHGRSEAMSETKLVAQQGQQQTTPTLGIE
jgi:hypothetical protein